MRHTIRTLSLPIFHYWTIAVVCFPTILFGNPRLFEEHFEKKRWDATVQLAFDTIQRYPNSAEPLAKGAYALFQKGYANAALIFLKRLTPEQWKRLKKKQPGFVDTVFLLQKKVPLTIIPGRIAQTVESTDSNYLRDEIRFNKGRQALESGDKVRARSQLSSVSNNSRYYAKARYLLGTAAIEEKNYDLAAQQISRMFDPTLFQQSTEFWQDMSSEMSAEWGASLKVLLDPSALNEVKLVGELGVMGVARILYARKEFELAIAEYKKIHPNSPYLSRSKLETIWALLRLNRHDEAQKAASALTVDGSSFESVEARIVRAVILADQRKSDVARQALVSFDQTHKYLKRRLEKYAKYGIAKSLPAFVLQDIQRDKRLKAIRHYNKVLTKEVAQLRRAGSRIYPVYSHLAGQLSSLVNQAERETARITKSIVKQRLKDLDRLYIQSKLIRAETYLEDREALRREFRKYKTITPDMQKDHDRRLVTLLRKAVEEVEPVLEKSDNLFLKFRQSELLWELGTAHLILAQTSQRKENERKAQKYKKRSLALSENITYNHPKFKKHDQSSFFTGFAQLEMDKEAQAMKTLESFVQRYPLHENVPDAYRILADYRFDKNDFKAAIQYFKKVLEFDGSPVVGYAFYKIAWSAYNLRDYGKALLALERAFLWAHRTQASGKRVLSLKREAKRDLITVYSEVGDHQRALEYFERFIGKDNKTYSWLEALAKLYDESGQYEKSIYIYNVLISLDDTSEKNISHYTAIVRGNSALLRWDAVIKTTREMLDLHKKDLLSPQEKPHPAFEAEATIREASLAQHFEFKQTEVPEIIERILTLDRLYFEAFASWPSSQVPLYKYAFFLHQKKRHVQAAVAYRKHWDRFKGTLKEPLKEEALRNLLNALQRIEADKKVDALKAEAAEFTSEESTNAKTPSEGLAFTNEAAAIVEYAQEYAQLYPNNKHSRTIAFLRATTLLKYERIKEGIQETQALFNKNNKDKIAKSAFKNLSVAYYKTKDWKRVFDWASELLSRRDKGMRAYKKRLVTVREEALFLWADKTKDNNEAANLFLRALNDPHMKRLKEKSLYNAIVRYHEAEDGVQVLALSNQLQKLAPKSPSLRDLAGIRATLYQESGDYLKALPLLEQFISKPPNDVSKEVVLQATLNTALISQGAGKNRQALALYKKFLKGTAEKNSGPGLQAQRGIDYIVSKSNRKPASVYKPWNKLMQRKRSFEKRPLPKKGKLSVRIKKGAQRLEANVKRFLDASSSEDTPDKFAFEAYCAVPNLYVAYANAVFSLADTLPPKAQAGVRQQLSKVTEPLKQKADTLAVECLKKSLESNHDGPQFRYVNSVWGWEKDKAQKERVATVVRYLQEAGPWVSPAPLIRKDSELIQTHLRKRGNLDTWYTLAKNRLDKKRWSLSRLTFIDTLNKQDPSERSGEGAVKKTGSLGETHRGRVLNALAYIEWKTSNPPGISLIFKRAAEAGSVFANANLALIYLQRAQLEQGFPYLKEAYKRGVFDKIPELKRLSAVLLPPDPVPAPTNVSGPSGEQEAEQK